MHLFERIAHLENEHATFAIATVVARTSPVSSHLGDRALIFPDGHMEGFVGGSCSRDIVRRQALAAIHSRRPLLLQIRPETGAADAPRHDAERVVIPMSCSSEGAVDVYIEPCVPLRRLVVAGFTPVACELVRLASLLEYDVVHVVDATELGDVAAPPGVRVVELRDLAAFLDALAANSRDALLAVVASQGHYDEAALEIVLGYDLTFVGLLASRRRASNVAGILAQQGVPAERIATIRTPVGLDIGARNPGEVAVSVLAEIIAHAAAAAGGAETAAAETGTALGHGADDAVDPICGMNVERATARHRYEHAGTTYVFCCAGCRSTFAADPERYLAASGSA